MKDNNLKFIPSKNGKPGYYITDITLNYRRIRKYAGRTKEAARAYLAKLILANKEGKLLELIKPEPKTKTDTFSTYARALLDSAEWKAKRSSSRNESLYNHLNQFFKDTRLEDINAGNVREYRTIRQNEGASPGTINRESTLLKSVLYCAEYEGIIKSNPIRGRRVKKLEENGSREKSILNLKLKDEDLRRLIECAPDYFKSILKLALITGMRRNEILKMKWKDINLNLGTIRIPAENSKTKKERVIPIDSNLIIELDLIEKKSEYVFMNPETGKRRKDIRKAFEFTCKAAGIPTSRKEGLTFHDLRHLAAYELVKATDVITAAGILGHSDINMTMRYVHPTDQDKRNAIEKVSENLFQCRQNVVNGKNSNMIDDTEGHSQVN